MSAVPRIAPHGRINPLGGHHRGRGYFPLMCDGKPPELRLFVPSTRSLPYVDITGLDITLNPSHVESKKISFMNNKPHRRFNELSPCLGSWACREDAPWQRVNEPKPIPQIFESPRSAKMPRCLVVAFTLLRHYKYPDWRDQSRDTGQTMWSLAGPRE
jgi:hypothetical protein